MPSFVALVNLGTVGDDITSVKLYACTDSSCTSCVSLSGYTSVLVSSFPRNIDGIPMGTTNIKVESIGRCNVSQCISIIGIPTAVPTSTPAPTATNTPTATPIPATATPIPPTSTPIPESTSTPIPPTSTPIPPTSTPIPPTSTPIPPTSTPIPPTSTPIPPTATPTPTPGSGCITISESSNGTSQTTCLGQSYNTESTRVTATLNAVAQVAVTARVYTNFNLCYGGTQETQYDIIIPAGQLSNYQDIITSTTVDCGQYGCQPEGASIVSYSGITQGYSMCATPTPTPTLTPTPTPTLNGSGQCYGFELQSTVTQSNYGVRYTPPGQYSRDELFSQMLAVDGESAAIFNICSTVDPTLLDYTGGSLGGTSVGQVNGITRTGPNGACSNTLGCVQ